ncbi:MAG: ribosomal protein S18-alanine N-acetyltransferase [Chitinivibrionia bacterium]|nr:ribosomal protein S18-alanine N-acetyltransferase [Chitinivibrionia bacterium]
MFIVKNEICDKTAAQICEIQQKMLFENSDVNSVKTAIKNGVLFFVEFDDKQNVVCFSSVMPVGEEWEIYDVATVSEWQNRGLAKKIISEILNFAAKNGAKSLFLEVRESNEKAINIYSKFGFEKYAVRKNYYANGGENAICMKKHL